MGRCLGRTRNLRRCKNKTEKWFCPKHRQQPFRWLLTLIMICGAIASLVSMYISFSSGEVSIAITSPPSNSTVQLIDETHLKIGGVCENFNRGKHRLAIWVQISGDEIYFQEQIKQLYPDETSGKWQTAEVILGKGSKNFAPVNRYIIHVYLVPEQFFDTLIEKSPIPDSEDQYFDFDTVTLHGAK